MTRWLPLLLLLSLSLSASTQASEPVPAQPPAAQPAQQLFETPEKAAEALIAAAEHFDIPALTKILGHEGIDLVVTADKVESANQSKAFAAQAQEKHAIVADPANAKVAILEVGPDGWPSPIPIVQTGSGQWHFDVKTGRMEIHRRRIGGNELDAIQVCRGYVEAQHEYALVKHAGSGVNQYAQRIISTPGKQDGLAWKTADGKWEGPVAETVAKVIAEGYSSRRQPYHGYYFKVLKGQGPSAPLGAMSFVVKGVMIGGFALAAAPAEYGNTGVMSFIVSHDGVVYEKDLGAQSLEVFKAMQLFDPDSSWNPLAAP